MSDDDAASQRLLAYCSRLPEVPQQPEKAIEEARFALACFAQRRQAIESELRNADAMSPALQMLRCELQALDAACSVVRKITQRRTGLELQDA